MRYEEITFFFAAQEKIWQAHSDLNREFRRWKPTFYQLNYTPANIWSERRESNPQHPVW
jgi:hypothetical protein